MSESPYEQWWDATDQLSDPDAHFTWGEEVWKAAQRDVWEAVFQIVSDNCHMATRNFISKLEAARDEDGCGPIIPASTETAAEEARP